MSISIIETTDPDFWPCPEGCGGATEDEAGGPCRRCWDKIDKWPRDEWGCRIWGSNWAPVDGETT